MDYICSCCDETLPAETLSDVSFQIACTRDAIQAIETLKPRQLICQKCAFALELDDDDPKERGDSAWAEADYYERELGLTRNDLNPGMLVFIRNNY